MTKPLRNRHKSGAPQGPESRRQPGVFCYDYPRPAVAVDLVVTRTWKPAAGTLQRQILLIRRGQPPFANCWALPGGFVDEQETLEAAAERELFEETTLKAQKLIPLGAFSRVDRDPRGRVISFAFWSEIPRSAQPRAGDDAAETEWFSLRKLPPLAFDHAEIVAAARRLWKQRPSPPRAKRQP